MTAKHLLTLCLFCVLEGWEARVTQGHGHHHWEHWDLPNKTHSLCCLPHVCTSLQHWSVYCSRYRHSFGLQLQQNVLQSHKLCTILPLTKVSEAVGAERRAQGQVLESLFRCGHLEVYQDFSEFCYWIKLLKCQKDQNFQATHLHWGTNLHAVP